MKATNRNRLFKIILTSLLIALNVIMERFLSINVWNQSIGFSFITVAFAAAFLGIPYAVCVGAIGDLIGALFFPFAQFFIGYTVSNAIAAFIIAIFIHKNATPVKITVGVIINKLITSVALNTLWITVTTRDSLDAFPVVLLSRIPQFIIMLIVEPLVLILLFSEKSKFRASAEKTLNKLIKQHK